MSVKLRLTRMGNKKRSFFRIVATNTASRRDGRPLEFLGYYIFTKFFILHMHHCIVEIRIEFLTNCFDRFYSDSFQCAHHLFIDLIHSIYERIIFLFFRYGLKSAFKVVYNRKNFFYNIFGSDLIHR